MEKQRYLEAKLVQNNKVKGKIPEDITPSTQGEKPSKQ